MLEFDADDQELQLFLAENNDHLQALDQNIIQLEITDDIQLLQSIFRSAHTIKGGAGLIGHHRMAELAHDMENVLDALRAGSLRVRPAIVDALLAALDALRLLNEEVIARTPSPINLGDLRARLAACLHAEQETAPEAPSSSAREAGAGVAALAISPICPVGQIARSGSSFSLAASRAEEEKDLPSLADSSSLYEVWVTVDPDCGLSAARTLQAYLELRRAGKIVQSTPTPEGIEADGTTHRLHAVVAISGMPSMLEINLSQITDVLEVRVEPVTRALAADQPEAGPVAAPQPPLTSGAGGQATSQQPDPRPARPAAPHGIGETPPEKERRSGGDRRSGEDRRVGGDRRPQQENSIRISVGIIDDLMSLVSELVLGRTRLQTLRAQLQQRYASDESVANLEDAVGHLDQVCNDLQSTVMKARMLPVENVFNKFPRLVRDLASAGGKQVSFTMSGNETELDRSVIEQLSDPLVHLLRNAIDHGIESPGEREAMGKPRMGSIALSAAPFENHIVIEVRDDGRGIDGEAVKAAALRKGMIGQEAADRLSEHEAVELVFLPSVSTARTVTDISGRGVGMDIVKATLERMGGRVSIDTTPGKGTTFSITLPLTLAIMQALLVAVNDAVYALPLNQVTEILSVPSSQIQMLQGTEATLLRGTILPLVRLRHYYGHPAAHHASGVNHIVATHVDGQLLGLVVDRFIGEQEIVIKPLGTYLGLIRGLAGAIILGDGRIGLLVDVAALKNWSPEQPRMVASA